MQANERSLPRIGTVENYRHLWMLSIWAVYLLLFFLAEHTVVDNYHVMHCALDDLVPFCEWLIFPYFLWIPMMAVMTAYLAFWDAENFRRFMTFIALGFLPVIVFDMLWPNGQDLRPAVFARENFATWLVSRIYAADTNTNVLPSMHVIGCAALTLACFDSQPLCKRHLQWVALSLGLLICASTVLVKQHSILDVFVAIPVSVILYFIVYHKTFRTMRQTA